MTTKRKTTQPRAKQETVAEEEGGPRAHEDEAVAEPTPDVVEEPTEAVAAEPAPPNDMVAVADDKGFCDNHPDRAAVLVVNVPWTKTQRFCNLDIPSQYRYLLP